MDPLVGYKIAKQLLKERFGHPYMIASSFVKSVTEGALIKPTDGVELLAFADQLTDCENTLTAIGYLDEINSADNLKRVVVERLPYHLIVKWFDKAQAIPDTGEKPRLHHISQFVMTRAKTANNPVFAGILRDDKSRSKAPQQKSGPKSNFNVQGENDGDRNPNNDCYPSSMSKESHAVGQCSFCSGQHSLTKCENFQKQRYVEKIKIVIIIIIIYKYFNTVTSQPGSN